MPARRHPRFKCGLPMRVTTPFGDVRGICRDLSLGGGFFAGPLLPTHARVEIEIEAPQRAIRARARVLYQHAYSDSLGVGIAFEALAEDDGRSLMSLLEALAATAQLRSSETPPPMLLQPPLKR